MTSARERHRLRADAAHAAATAPSRWLCRVEGCAEPGPHPAQDPAAAERAAMAHYARRHATPPPDDLDEQRAAWHAAGKPPLGEFPRNA